MRKIAEIRDMLNETIDKLNKYNANDYLTRDTYQYLLARLDTLVDVLKISGIPDNRIEDVYEYLGNNKLPVQLLANEIEQFMFERGEYDLHLEDRIRWLKTDDREGNAKYIRDEILKYNIGFLTEYLTSEISSMCEDDELIPKAEKLIEELIEKLNAF